MRSRSVTRQMSAATVGRWHFRSELLASMLTFSSVPAMAADRVEPTLELPAVLIEITWVADSLELAEFRKRYESRIERSRSSASIGAVYRNRPDDGIKGFSVLGKRDDDWVCLIFVERPKVVNDARTLQLGHELAHCLLGAYH